MANSTLQAAGAMGFVASAGAWWILAAQILASVGFPINLPVGDMSTVFPAIKEKVEGSPA
jgi:hypothetical protein